MELSELKQLLEKNPSKENIKLVLDELLDIIGECFVDIGLFHEEEFADWILSGGVSDIDPDDIADMYDDSEIASEFISDNGTATLVDILDELIEDFE